jgi:hypothetical protein
MNKFHREFVNSCTNLKLERQASKGKAGLMGKEGLWEGKQRLDGDWHAGGAALPDGHAAANVGR